MPSYDAVTFHLKWPWADGFPEAVPVRWNLVHGRWSTVPPARNTVLIPYIWNESEFQQTFPWADEVLRDWKPWWQQKTITYRGVEISCETVEEAVELASKIQK